MKLGSKIKQLPNESNEDYIKRLEGIVNLIGSQIDPDESVKPDKDADYSDEWRYPSINKDYWVSKPPENKMMFYIEREKHVPVTGNVAYISEWSTWSSHDTKEARDKEYRDIKARHPGWSIRKKQYNPYYNRLRASFA